jgi:methionine sulfoxide reductase catalytic subunit
MRRFTCLRSQTDSTATTPQLGYKMVKWIERIEFIPSKKLLDKGEGGKNEDDEYVDLLPNI